MAYIVTEPCVDCKYTDCAAVCPVEAFHELPDKLLINPDTCIDCDACLPECPVEAIFSDMSIPEEYMNWLEINQEAENYPIISTKQPALYGSNCKGQPE
ncbi:MAG TPA: ferredoxin family protein [Pyrinomonadaceae bacterium]|nr:ferredoxin family protein [Pyrinomonadaceae bacterium]